ncbi:MAG: VWA domain-containing protein [Alphaproteobacteria bacterium]|jgi:hypothetical protein|nr:VWA domain-containing protein [Alphaproteobacteria bacterium]MDP6589511.1 VWA domain-containing protein [Alphaproteobacteria bacterium]MDP6818515.1 VWA domain-containing protein [Alphaproteobacteria bacterium]|tara:strand:- start:895 stop:1608 length:714 start_codon:yes stop_codon:yes gene_type:complete
MSERKKSLPAESGDTESDIDRFLGKVAATPPPLAGQGKGRLLFAMDATASREPSWDRACHIQGEMFEATAALGGLSVQLAYYRGFNEFRATKWLSNSRTLVRHMSAVHCLGGHTQIRKILRHAIRETKRQKLGAIVFVGDCMEENVDDLCAMAGELGLLKVPAFMFHEGNEKEASLAFRQIARLTGGAYLQFDAHSAAQLKSLLSAVAVYAAGGRRALISYGKRQGGAALQISHQVK